MILVRIAVFLLAAVVTSCAHAPKDTLFWARVGNSPEGMSREEVTARLGEPTRTESVAGLDTLWYENVYRKRYYGVDHYIQLRDGRVVGHGSRPVYDSPEGLSREEITTRLGEPTRIERGETGETLWYENVYRRSYYGVDHYIQLRDGIVVGHGSRPVLSFSEKIGDLMLGMSKEDALRILGEPDEERTEGTREVIVYQAYTSYERFGASQPVDYHLAFEDGKLVKKGDNYRRGFERPPSFDQGNWEEIIGGIPSCSGFYFGF